MSTSLRIAVVQPNGEVQFVMKNKSDRLGAAIGAEMVDVCTGYFSAFLRNHGFEAYFGDHGKNRLDIFCDDISIAKGLQRHVWNPLIQGPIVIHEVNADGDLISMTEDTVNLLKIVKK